MAKDCDHTSVGMVVYREGKLLLIERMKYPFGLAPPAGHVDGDETFEYAAKRELQEEVGLEAMGLKLIFEGRKENVCRRENGTWHFWKIYEVEVIGEIKRNVTETKKVDWFVKEEIEKLAEKTKKYIDNEVSEEEWQANPGLEIFWYELLQVEPKIFNFPPFAEFKKPGMRVYKPPPDMTSGRRK